MKKIFLMLGLFVLGLAAFANDDLLIRGEDMRLVYVPEESGDVPKDVSFNDNFDDISGFHLYIRKKEGVESVLLCDTTKDPDGKNDNYSYRALEYNSVNGDEVTYLNGKPLVSEYAKYRLADSTPEPDEEFGEAFHIYIPMEMQYGYPWARNGKIDVKRGTFVNIRAFSKKYADYDGEFADNPFMFDLQIPDGSDSFEPVLTDNYSPEAAASFTDIAGFSGGEMVISNLDKLPDDVMDSIERISPKENVDIVFAIDATGSMKDDVKVLRDKWVPKLMETLSREEDSYGTVRLGLLLYRDYGDDFEYKKLPVKLFDFTEDVESFKKNLNRFVINGSEGGDLPEAVYEALYGSIDFYKWRSGAQKKIILIGDAEPHPTPRGSKKYTKELVSKLSKSKGVVIDTIIVPDNKSDRGRW